MNRFDEIRERMEKITPGPWSADEKGNVSGADTGYGELRIATLENCARVENIANGTFIANAPADMQYLLDVNRLQDRTITILRKEIEKLKQNF